MIIETLVHIITKWTLSLSQPLVNVGSPTHTPHVDCQLVRGTIYFGWSDSGPIAGWHDRSNTNTC